MKWTDDFSVWLVTVAVLQIEGENRIQMNRKHKAHVSFINIFTKALSPVLLTVTGSGLLEEKQEARWVFWVILKW